ncbi:MAG: hypothetical protein AAF490_20365 [Chloroflexota bacterium]
MKTKFVIVIISILFFITACGGGSQEAASEPEAQQPEAEVVEEATAEPEEVVEETESKPEPEDEVMEEDEEMMEEEVVEEETTEEMEEDEVMEEDEEMMEEEEDTAVGFGDTPMSGVDPDTGLEINPPSYGPGDTFIVRGTVISMNLTPVTNPEFLIESPEGVRYRVNTQPLEDTFFVDGSQWQPFEFRQGVGAMVTIEFDASLTTSDIPSGSDLVLVMQE